jgi:GR25 family glycosyltransferase involved in LPS biosynthesis
VFFNNLPVFYINLQIHKTRKAYIEEHFFQHNVLNVFRVDGVDGTALLNNTDLSGSELGCTLSHIKALQMFLNTDYDFAMICEDDVDISNVKKFEFNFYETLEYYNSEDYCLQLTISSREEVPINFLIHPRTFWDFSTTAYIVNRKYAKKIVDLYKNNNFDSFIKRQVYDPRGGIIISRPVADELIYNSCKTMSLPLFSFKDVEASVSTADENKRQLKKSIEQFNFHWKNFDKIFIENFRV